MSGTPKPIRSTWLMRISPEVNTSAYSMPVRGRLMIVFLNKKKKTNQTSKNKRKETEKQVV